MQALQQGESSQDSVNNDAVFSLDHEQLNLAQELIIQQLQGQIHELKSTIKSLEDDKALLAEENQNLKLEQDLNPMVLANSKYLNSFFSFIAFKILYSALFVYYRAAVCSHISPHCHPKSATT